MRAAGLLGTLLAASLAAGCPSTSNGPPPSGTPTPAPLAAREQPLLTATISDPKTFNPILAVDEPSNVAIGQLFDALVRLDPRTTEIEPSLATRWEYDADGTECTFHLRHDVLWQDGKPFTAADVVFTFDAIYDDRVPNSLKHVLTVDGQRLKVEALDDYTVRVRLPRPFAPLLNSIGVPIIPKHVLGDALAAGQFSQQMGYRHAPRSDHRHRRLSHGEIRAGAVHRAAPQPALLDEGRERRAAALHRDEDHPHPPRSGHGLPEVPRRRDQHPQPATGGGTGPARSREESSASSSRRSASTPARCSSPSIATPPTT